MATEKKDDLIGMTLDQIIDKEKAEKKQGGKGNGKSKQSGKGDGKGRRRRRGGNGGRSDERRGGRRRRGRGRGGRSGGDGTRSMSVFLGNLSWETSWQDLKDHCKRNQIREVTRADIFRKQNNRSKGCGIIEFDNTKSATRAKKILNGTKLNGREIFASYGNNDDGERKEDRGRGGRRGRRDDRRQRRRSRSRSTRKQNNQRAEGTQIYIGNLPFSVTWQQLKDCFKEYGQIERADVAEKQNGKSKGFGFVVFKHRDDALKAKKEMNDAKFDGRTITIRVDD